MARLVFIGLSITSSWGNGHATTYRGLLKALARRGHEVVFLECDVPWYAANRDLPAPPYCRTILYRDVGELTTRHSGTVRGADAVIVGSYVPDGIQIGHWALEQATGAVAFYDIDTPVTLAKLEAGTAEYIDSALVRDYDLYLSFTGGPTLQRLDRMGSPHAAAFYCSVDPDVHGPVAVARRWRLGYLGTYSADRQPTLSALLLEPAFRMPDAAFVVAGPQYPLTVDWPANVTRIEHLPPGEHAAFYGAQNFTLNVTRADMKAAGYSPSVRLFEAAACGVPIVTDRWPGLDTIFRVGAEILVAESSEEAVAILENTSSEQRSSIGMAARAAVLSRHTCDHRAAELEALLQSATARNKRRDKRHALSAAATAPLSAKPAPALLLEKMEQRGAAASAYPADEGAAMDRAASKRPGVGRRELFRFAAAGAALTGAPQVAAAAVAAAAASENAANVGPQPAPANFADNPTTADILIETLQQWGVSHVFGVVGDGINPLIEALRKRRDKIAFIPARHEEAAAFMACGFAKHTGRLGVCVGTTGPGAVHLLNGLYDAKFDGAPVLALTGLTFHDLIGVRYQQDLDTVALMAPVALYNTQVSGPQHAIIVANRACRAALGDRGVAHLAISKDVQLMKLSADPRSMRNPGARTSSSWVPAAPAAPGDQLRAAADILNAGTRVAVLCGQGALAARDEVTRLADTLGAPVAKALLGKAVLPDDSPFTTGGIGDLGTAPSSWAMKACDTVLILGSTMPWEEYYPTPGQARAVQVDLKPDRLGLRYPVEIGLAGDVKATLQALLPLLQRKSDRGFLTEAQQRTGDWNRLLDAVEKTARSPLRPQMVIRAVSDLAANNAVVSLDCGANTHFAARCFRLRASQRFSGTGMLATMAPGLPYAIAAQLAYPDRQSIAIVGDGGFAMLMAELSTAVAHNLPVKIVLLKNNALAEVMFEQREIGNPNYGCELPPIDFVAFARACGADGFHCEHPEEVRPAIEAALASAKPALVEAVVDAEEKPTKPDELRA